MLNDGCYITSLVGAGLSLPYRKHVGVLRLFEHAANWFSIVLFAIKLITD